MMTIIVIMNNFTHSKKKYFTDGINIFITIIKFFIDAMKYFFAVNPRTVLDKNMSILYGTNEKC